MSLLDLSPTSLANLSSTPKTILITGGSSGIGLATATLLRKLNSSHNLVLLDLQPPPSSFPRTPANTLFVRTNITSWKAQRLAFSAAYEKFRRIDAVFVNAGITEYKDQFFTDELDADGQLKEPDRRVLRVDMNAASDTVKLAIHYLRKNGKDGGSIVMTASIAGYLASAGAPLYSAAKHGIVGLLRALKLETAKLHISISVVAPGITITPLILDNRSGREASQTPEKQALEIRDQGVPVNKAESVALGVCWLIDQGMSANGAGIMIQGDRFADVERGLAKSRGSWMGKEMLDLFRGGRSAVLFDRLPDGAEKPKL